jgi:sn-glycerol 3-phosphate transport system ATP-binding protein
MRFELKALQRDLGGTFVHVTHDQAEAMSLADAMVVMDRGLVQQLGRPLDVYQEPANLFVATFVGIPTMNIVLGEVADGVFRAPGWDVPVGGAASGPTKLVVRSEDLLVQPAEKGASGRVHLVEQVGSDAFVEVTTDFGRLVARTPASTPLLPGDAVTVQPSGNVHRFDPTTGVRLA